MEQKINCFVEKLIGIDYIENKGAAFENPYKKEVCRYNLKNYLMFISTVKPQIMFIGEAPGYRGCQLTGIPFTDEKQLMNPENYFAIGDWQRHPNTGMQKEVSAGVIWEGLRQRRLIPLMWNAFPFHPHKLGDVESNRTPNSKEVKWGQEIVAELCSIFDIKEKYAIGKKALKQLDLDDRYYIRHPSHGGKTECLQMISKIGIDKYEY